MGMFQTVLTEEDLCLLGAPADRPETSGNVEEVRQDARAKVTHHYLHGTPAGRAPVHRHSLVDHVGHRSHRFCKPSQQIERPITYESFLTRREKKKSTKRKEIDIFFLFKKHSLKVFDRLQ